MALLGDNEECGETTESPAIEATAPPTKEELCTTGVRMEIIFSLEKKRKMPTHTSNIQQLFSVRTEACDRDFGEGEGSILRM